MDTFVLLAVIVVPILLGGAVMYAVHRWARKNDPMGGSIDRWWRTTGTTSRFTEDDR